MFGVIAKKLDGEKQGTRKSWQKKSVGKKEPDKQGSLEKVESDIEGEA